LLSAALLFFACVFFSLSRHQLLFGETGRSRLKLIDFFFPVVVGGFLSAQLVVAGGVIRFSKGGVGFKLFNTGKE
jgi:hypothetical protein